MLRRSYVSGPLFNSGERYVQLKIATILESLGYCTFLPQSDGFELATLSGLTNEELKDLIFSFDVYQLWASDFGIFTASGSEPDSGTISEAALAFSMGKAVIIFDEDSRVFSNRGNLNPLFAGLADSVIDSFDKIPAAVASLPLCPPVPFHNLAPKLQETILRGYQYALQYNK